MILKTIGTRVFGPVQRRKSGQGLVEMAIMTPLLLIMFIGVLEVGWALRGYMIILNASREAARFAARGRYIDYAASTSVIQSGYLTVITHTLDTLGYPYDSTYGYAPAITQGTADVAMKLTSTAGNKSGYGTVIISHFFIDTQKPCNPPDDCNGNGITSTVETPEVDCAGFRTELPSGLYPEGYTADDVIQTPSTNPVTQTYTYPSPTNFTSDIYQRAVTLTNQYRADNNYFNCVLHSKDANAPYSTNSVIIVEIYFDQPQLLGVPFVSNSLTDPVHLYAYTEMRITGDSRSSGR
jgi:hypothetical protein